jgi:hypothetical protein
MPVASRLQVCEATPLLTPTPILLLPRLILDFLTARGVSLLVGGVARRIQTSESLKEARAPYQPPPLTRQIGSLSEQTLRIYTTQPPVATNFQPTLGRILLFGRGANLPPTRSAPLFVPTATSRIQDDLEDVQ